MTWECKLRWKPTQSVIEGTQAWGGFEQRMGREGLLEELALKSQNLPHSSLVICHSYLQLHYSLLLLLQYFILYQKGNSVWGKNCSDLLLFLPTDVNNICWALLLCQRLCLPSHSAIDWICVPSKFMLKPNPQCDSTRRWDLWKVGRSWG